MNNISRSGLHDWTFDGTWPYAPNYFETGVGRMHYVEEGPRDGRPVVLVHGNPTWGYLYRQFIAPLAESGYRVVVPSPSHGARRTPCFRRASTSACGNRISPMRQSSGSKKPGTTFKEMRPSSSCRISSSF